MAASDGNHDYFFKLILLGESGVGKTCMLSTFTEGIFSPNFITTIGIDYHMKTVECSGKRIKLQIWDTAGQERFRTITPAYYRGVVGVLLVYDITDPDSFKKISKWLNSIAEHADPGVQKLLLGNKSDLEDQRKVAVSEGQQLANSEKIGFLETSAKTNTNIDKAFMEIARLVLERFPDQVQQKPSDNIQLPSDISQAPPKEKKKCSC
jgi:Ras-related protein Rab-8A